jgi:hypothetical protein
MREAYHIRSANVIQHSLIKNRDDLDKQIAFADPARQWEMSGKDAVASP